MNRLPSLPNRRTLKLAADTPWLLSRRIRNLSSLDRFPRIHAASLITFDVFDTAILRSVSHPDDVFGLSAWRAVKRHKLDLDPDTLMAQRKRAHLSALRQQAIAGRQEATIEDIYQCHPIEDPAIRRLLLAEELATEADVVQPNEAVCAIYRHLSVRGARLAFLSDTPFSSAFVSELLISAGYPGPLEVFVSSEFGATKASGGLFPRLAKQLGLEPEQVWHIGDNVRSDVVRARASGIHPLWYRPRMRRHYVPTIATAAEDSLARSVMEGAKTARAQACADASSTLRSVGREIAGPAYLAFAQWLIRDLSQAPAGTVYFLARDSLILKTFYDRLRDSASAPPSAYLFVSRRSLVFPMINSVGEVELDLLCSHERVLPLEEFVSRIGLDMNRFTAQAKDAGLEPQTLVRTPADVAALRAFFAAIAPFIVEHAQAERVLLVRYLEQEGFVRDQPVAICDIGWSGQSQKALARIRHDAGTTQSLAGFYIGTSEAIRSLGPSEGTAKGWFIDRGIPTFGLDFRKFSWVLMELLLSAPHGSTISYREDGAVVRPVLRDQPGDQAFQSAAGDIQAGAMVFLEVYARAFGKLPPPAVDEPAVVGRLGRLFLRPSLAEAIAIGDVTMIEGLGDTRTGFPIAAPPSWRAVLQRPTALRSAYRQAFWRRAFTIRIVRSWHVAGAISSLRRGR